MQYVQTLPVVLAPTTDDTVHAAEGVAVVHAVDPETSSNASGMMLNPHLPALEQMWEPRALELEKERRRMCRRIYQSPPPLQELRAGPDRRRHNQRRSDLTTAVDEKI